MGVIYSIGAKFAGGGIGTTAFHAVHGLYHHDLLQRLICGSYLPSDIPEEKIRSLGLPSRLLRKLATYDPGHRLSYLDNIAYDLWASRQMERGDIFHVWNGFGVRSLLKARALGMVTIVDRASSHPRYQLHLLEQEYDRWGLTYKTAAKSIQRNVKEIHLADYVLIPSEFARSSFVKERYPSKKLLQIPFGVDNHRFQPAEKNGTSTFQVLFVGQIGPRKGVGYLLEAWQCLGWKDAQLNLLGSIEPQFRPILREYRHLSGLKLFNYVPDPLDFFHQADVFAFPSIEEGSALVTYEAMACGLPLITTPNAGSVLRDGLEGFLVPIRDADALAMRLEELRSNEKLRSSMGTAARQRALEFTWQKYGLRLSQVYEALTHTAPDALENFQSTLV
jgi:glycosyltransferase involved in cell wall biosynthesis